MAASPNPRSNCVAKISGDQDVTDVTNVTDEGQKKTAMEDDHVISVWDIQGPSANQIYPYLSPTSTVAHCLTISHHCHCLGTSGNIVFFLRSTKDHRMFKKN